MNDKFLSRGLQVRHLSVILLIFILFFLPNAVRSWLVSEPIATTLLFSVGFPSIYMAIFLVNYFYLVPKVLLRNKQNHIYFLSNIFSIAIGCLLIKLFTTYMHDHSLLKSPPEEEPIFFFLQFMVRDIIMMVLSATLAYGLYFSTYKIKIEQQQLEMSSRHLEIELQSLKAQLNPHFLFNTLNNIYALIAFAPDNAQKAVHNLSSMLRFIIYESGAATVPLEKELAFVEDYVELMKLRLGSGIKLSVNINTQGSQNVSIAPLIFLTLIENAFKHVNKSDNGSFISINIGMVSDTCVKCETSNSKSTSETVQDESPHGVGLSNIQRQLSLLYPERHSLDITDTGHTYTAILKIELTQV